jgi:hypothetical protein
MRLGSEAIVVGLIGFQRGVPCLLWGFIAFLEECSVGVACWHVGGGHCSRVLDWLPVAVVVHWLPVAVLESGHVWQRGALG